MIIGISLIVASFIWLLYETKFLTIRLLVGSMVILDGIIKVAIGLVLFAILDDIDDNRYVLEEMGE